MSYSSIFNSFKDEFIKDTNTKFIVFLNSLKDDERKYEIRSQNEFIESLKMFVRDEITKSNIDEKTFNRFRNLFLDGIRDYKTAPDKIESALVKKVIPLFNEEELLISIEDLIKLLAIKDSIAKLDTTIQSNDTKIIHNFDKNQIYKVSIIPRNIKKRKVKTLPHNTDTWDIDKRLFLFFLEKNLANKNIQYVLPNKFCKSLDSSFICYARFIANTLGVHDKNLYLKSKYIKSPIYTYVKDDRFKNHLKNINFLEKLSEIELPDIIKDRIISLIKDARKAKKQ